MRIVIALGGNALLRRGEVLTQANQATNVRVACEQIAKIWPGNELIIAHGNGPQVGMLALQTAASESDWPLDVLGAQTEAMIGYLIERELGNLLPVEVPIVTMLTMVEVDPADPAFAEPTKPIGPVYSEQVAKNLAAQRGWSIAADGEHWRRVVASPAPKRIFELRAIRLLADHGSVVICAGGGGIPTGFDESGRKLLGIEAVIDKDLASALLAEQVGAEMLVIATDVDYCYLDWGTSRQRRILQASPAALQELDLAKGSMAPKVAAAVQFAERTGHSAVIGSLDQIEDLVRRRAGTRVSARVDGLICE